MIHRLPIDRERILFARLLAEALVAMGISRCSLLLFDLQRTRQVTGTIATAIPGGRLKSPSVNRLARAVTIVGHWCSAACLLQALTGMALFDRYGYDADLQIGVKHGDSRDADALEAHAWVRIDGEVVIGNRTDLDGYRPLVIETVL